MPRIILAHGAGAGLSHPWMQRWSRALGTLGDVHAFEYDYMAAGRRSPDRLPKLLVRHRRAWEEAHTPTGQTFLMGKSMGSRVGCHLSNEPDISAAGLVCFGYPLVGMGKTAKVRSEVLEALSTPILFIQGTRDRMCPLDLLEEVRGRMSAPSEVFLVETGNHSLEVTRTWEKQTGLTQATMDEQILQAVSRFAARYSSTEAA